CMYPTITGRDYVLCLKVNEETKLSIGDIITYEFSLYYSPLSYGRFITHRIIDLNEIEIRTRGDNLQKSDPPIKYYRVRGIAIAKCDHSFKIFETLNQRPELTKVLMRLESLITAEGSKTDTGRISVKMRSLLSIIFVIVTAIALPFLFLMT
ncbi:MAG: S26 family signal peptidase, partial [Candidatus Thermoplasmatota archaeon]|nr:S26 family signal peptidase [Candidatus Thermoplasmatota archaeon]